MFDTALCNILKNFSLVNDQVYFKPGNIIQVFSQQENLLAQVKTDVDIVDHDFCIYDLQKFLNAITLAGENLKVEHKDNSVVFKGKGKRIIFEYCSPDVIKKAPYQEIEMEDDSIELEADMMEIIKSATIMDLPDILFQKVDGEYNIIAFNSKSVTRNRYVVQTGVKSDKDINCLIKLDKLKLVDNKPEKYKVRFQSNLVEFTTKKDKYNITYWIAGGEDD